jgi:hypothetical protein
MLACFQPSPTTAPALALLWWMLFISGLPGFVSTLAIEVCIGYMSFAHVLPAYVASLMFAAVLILSCKYPCVEPAA